MGLFDYVQYDCPHCHLKIEEQSKGGSCTLGVYHLESAPVSVVEGLLNCFTYCPHCQKQLIIERVVEPVYRVRIVTDEETKVIE